jgi:choline dehydrogenase
VGLPSIFAPFEEETKMSKQNRRRNLPQLLAVQTQITRHHRAIGRDLKLMRRDGYSCHMCCLRPKSRGTISLANANPATPPIIDHNFFSHPDDLKTMIAGIRLTRKILAAPAFDEYRIDEIHPGGDKQSDEEIGLAIKEKLGIVYHPVGTCKMGNDEMAVVDSQLRVHGIKNLRVIDASIMPTLIGANTNATAIMIGEKGADIIRAGA